MKSYFKFLSRNKAYTFINVAGLVVSLMFIILMGKENYFFLWSQAAEGIGATCPDVEQTCCVMSQNGA